MGISIILPVYNTEKYLKQCIESVLRQTVKFEEIILVDDGSTDGSGAICKEYADRNDNVMYIKKENGGPGSARNTGMLYTTSEYVMFLDTDDYLREDAVELVLHHMTEEDLDVLYFDTEVKVETDDIKKYMNYDRVGKLSSEVMTGAEYFIKTYPDKYVVQLGMVAFKREHLIKNKIIFPERLIHVDLYYSLKAMITAEKVMYIPERIYRRRYREGSLVVKAVRKYDYNSHFNIMILCWEFLSELHDDADNELKEHIYYYIVRDFWFAVCRYEEDKHAEKEKLNRIYNTLVYKFCEVVKKIDENGCFNKVINVSFMCNFISYVLKNNNMNQLCELIESRELLKKYICIYREKIMNVFDSFGLNDENKLVCIYGTGNHTDRLLNLYNCLCGDVICKLIFANTEVDADGKRYREKKIYDIKEIPKDTDIIIVSSNIYEDEMYENALNLYENNFEIKRFYDEYKGHIFLEPKSMILN